MRLIVCGSRDWNKQAPIWTYLDGLLARWDRTSEFLLAQGGANGADRIAREWFRARETDFEPFGNFKHHPFPANWEKHGRGAGPKRNREMFDTIKPNLVMAFKNNFDWTLSRGGTEDMVRYAYENDCPVYVVSEFRMDDEF